MTATTGRVLVIDGHPNPAPGRLCHALAGAYAEGSRAAGHDVETIRVADIGVPLLRSADEFRNREPAAVFQQVQDSIASANHFVLIYPLWLGTMPAMLKAFLEQVFRPGFAFGNVDEGKGTWSRKLRGRSARVVVTMGMPAFFYRWIFRAHSLKSLERNVLKLCGISPVRETLRGMVESASEERRRGWLQAMRDLGRRMR